MTTAITLARLRDLRLSGMADALSRQLEQVGTYDALPFLERFGLLVEQECLEREHRKQDRLVRPYAAGNFSGPQGQPYPGSDRETG